MEDIDVCGNCCDCEVWDPPCNPRGIAAESEKKETNLDEAGKKILLFEPAIEESTGLSKQLETVLQSDQSDRSAASDATAKATGKLLEDDLAKERLKIRDADESGRSCVEMRFHDARKASEWRAHEGNPRKQSRRTNSGTEIMLAPAEVPSEVSYDRVVHNLRNFFKPPVQTTHTVREGT